MHLGGTGVLYAKPGWTDRPNIQNRRMRLERVFIHQLLRLVRKFLPILVMALIAIPAWNYVTRRVQRSGSFRAVRKLPTGVSVHTEGFTYSRTEGGRTQFTVHAKQSVVLTDNKYMLDDVDAVVFGETEKEPTRNIKGKQCVFQQETNDFECKGNVEVELDARTVVRSEQILYNHRERTITSPGRADVAQGGTTGRTNYLQYAVETGLLTLKGDVYIHTEDRTEVQAATLVFQEKENWTSLSGGVLLKAPNGWIQGLNGRSDLEAGTNKPKIITIDGNVTGEFTPAGSRDTWRIRSAWLEAEMSPAGVVQHVKTRGDAQIEKVGGNVPQRVKGEEIDTTLTNGRIDALEARQNASMVLGDGQTLTAPLIWTNGTGSIRTTGKSLLDLGDSTIDGREFNVENGEETVIFSTSRPAILKKAGEQESSADQTRATFDSRTNMLIELVQTGNFQFKDPQRTARAQSAQSSQGGTVITLIGSAVVTDADRRLEAPEIRLNQADNSFIATKNVISSVNDPEQQLLVKAARAEGGADSVVYTGNVQLWRVDAYVKADRIDARGQVGKGSRVHAEALPGKKVQSNLQNVRTTSETLDYDDANGLVHYTGHVHGQKQDMIMETPDMTVKLQDNKLTEIVASGGVTVTRGDRKGTGERAVYDAASDVVTLTGQNAQLYDKQQGLTQGSLIKIGKREETVSVQGETGAPTVTKHPVNGKK